MTTALNESPWVDRDALRITGIRAIVTAPEGIPLVVVKVETSDDGLYGLGCATFTQRWQAVVAAVNQGVAPMAVGRHPADIEDLTRAMYYSSYWRNGPVLNNALSGLDMALWDIAGKRHGVPVYELLGGRVRAAALTYLHAAGATVHDTIEHAAAIVALGWTHVRLQTGQPGLGTYGAPGSRDAYPNAPYPDGWNVEHYLRTTPELFAHARRELGAEVELLHDVHSRLTPTQAVLLARRLEEHRLFFLEDVVAPEHYDRLTEVRAASPVPIAVGELLSSVGEAAALVREHAVDYLRVHVSAVGGLTPARKLAAMCELVGVQTAWHAPGDVSPIGAAANVALDVTSYAFGIQEAHNFSDAALEVFPGTLTAVAGYLTPSPAPGWGVDLDEAAAGRFQPGAPAYGASAFVVRAPDGSLRAP
ncbi:MAG TPA: enolase C-terminal domain-like protein [Acidothermaceae bacterium]